jgi:hypothetical protein
VRLKSLFPELRACWQPKRHHIDKDKMLAELVRKALEEWRATFNLFNEVTEPELVDYLIFWMEAAERKYVYLLNEARQHKIDGLVELR